MEKEIYTYKKLEDKLNSIAKHIYQKYNVRINFCKIFGNRWSFYAGRNDLITIQDRIKLTDEIGIIVEQNNLDKQTWNDILSKIITVL